MRIYFTTNGWGPLVSKFKLWKHLASQVQLHRNGSWTKCVHIILNHVYFSNGNYGIGSKATVYILVLQYRHFF